MVCYLLKYKFVMDNSVHCCRYVEFFVILLIKSILSSYISYFTQLIVFSDYEYLTTRTQISNSFISYTFCLNLTDASSQNTTNPSSLYPYSSSSKFHALDKRYRNVSFTNAIYENT
uniref:SJCHGC07981 protein n=1 Tax=Schistosoma japonicum TaxID=6182 RepID=Q5DCQ6_SCHJA|nr:SJCHGC07981 protein [Schistosoma japonicum]